MFDDVIACPRCGMVSGRTDRFCRYCGGSLDKKGTIREYRHITSLFSDLSDYTPLTEELEPEELKDILDSLFTKSISIVTSYGGIVEKFVGDGVIALFGLDEVHEHDCVRAIHAAIEIHRFGRELTDTAANALGRNITMHTGINTGFVLVDQQSQAPFSHGVMGTPINIASRLSDLAGPDEIFIGETVMADAARYFNLENMGMKKIKGLKEPMNVYKILSARQAGVSIHREGGITSNMVGREEELAILMAELESPAKGSISSVCLCGDPGVGKSRLIQEFRAHVPSRFRWIYAQCLDHTKDTPYYPIAFLLRDLLEIRENATDAKDLQTRIGVFSCDPSHTSSIASLCGLAPGTEGTAPDVRKARLCDAAASLIHAAGKNQPLILCIEDIHWADQSTLDLLEYFLRHEDGACTCLFIISSRTRVSLSARDVHIALDDLTPEETGRMTEYMLENRHITETTRQYLYQQTGGNPFYVEEVVNYLIEKGVSFSRCAGKEIGEGIPSNIQGLVAARLENLGKNLKTLLQEASVIGKIFSASLLKAVSSAGHDMDTHLACLEKAGFIHVTATGVYSFRHALTRDVSYRTLLRRDRMKMHMKIGIELEGADQDKQEICDMLAYHFDLAGDAEKAIFYSIMAARKYQAGGSWVEAAAHYRTAEKQLSANSALPGSREKLLNVWEGVWSCARIFSPNHAIQALENLCRHYAASGMSPEEAFALIRLINLYSQKGLFQKALDTFDHAIFLAGDDEVLRGAAFTAVAYTYTYLGRPDRALAYLEQARPALNMPDTFLLAVNHLTTLTAFVWKGSIQEAMTWYYLTKRLSGFYMDLEIMADIYLGYLHYLCGSFNQARQVFERVALKERKLGSLAGGLSYLRIQSSIYFNARYTGNLDKAREDLRMFAAHDGEMKDSTALYDLYHAWIELEEGKYEHARDLLMKLWQVFQKGTANRVPYALNALAEALYNLGDMKKAGRLAQQCIVWNEQNGNRDQLIWALRIMGDIYIHQEMFTRAKDVLKRASCMARVCSMKPHTAWTLKSWGDYFLKMGKKRASMACCRRARTLWLEMDNPYQAGKLSSKTSQ